MKAQKWIPTRYQVVFITKTQVKVNKEKYMIILNFMSIKIKGPWKICIANGPTGLRNFLRKPLHDQIKDK